MKKVYPQTANSIRALGSFVLCNIIIILTLFSSPSVKAFDSFRLSLAGLQEMRWANSNGQSGDHPSGQIHGEITRAALSGDLQVRNDALISIIDGNWHVDWDEASFNLTSFSVVPNNLYRPGHHFDRNAGDSSSDSFIRGAKYLQEQRAIVISGLKSTGGTNLNNATQAMGRALHAMQDFFSHSNVIDLNPTQWKAAIAALKSASAPPAALNITGYDAATGNDLAGDTFGHDRFCKDNPEKNNEAQSRMTPGSEAFDSNLTKFQRARNAAVEFSKEWLKAIKNEVPGNAWPK